MMTKASEYRDDKDMSEASRAASRRNGDSGAARLEAESEARRRRRMAQLSNAKYSTAANALF